MTALRCTAKLLKAMHMTAVAAPAQAANRLGEWTANLVRVSRIQLMVAVSAPTRLGVVIDAAPYAGIPLRLQHRVLHALLELGVPANLAAPEAEAMLPLECTVTNSKSVLGTLNQYALEVEYALRDGVARSAAELTRRLLDTVVLRPPGIGFPADRAREVLGLPPRHPARG